MRRMYITLYNEHVQHVQLERCSGTLSEHTRRTAGDQLPFDLAVVYVEEWPVHPTTDTLEVAAPKDHSRVPFTVSVQHFVHCAHLLRPLPSTYFVVVVPSLFAGRTEVCQS